MKKNYLLILILGLFSFFESFAQLAPFDLSVFSTPATCIGNGALQFTTSATTAGSTINYSIYQLPNVTMPIATTPSNTLNGLNSGNYRIIATQTLGVQSNSQTQDIAIASNISPLNFNLTGVDASCGNNGSISVNMVSGNPISFEILSGPIILPPQSNGLFTNLVAGIYNIRVIDNCGQGTVQTFTLNSIIVPTNSFTILENEFPGDFLMLPTCNQINLGHRINIPTAAHIAFPLTFTFTVHPPNGSADLVTTAIQNLNPQTYQGNLPSDPLPFIFTIPYFSTSYTYDLMVTDACGNNYYRNNNVVNKKFNFNISTSTASCGTKNLQINPVYFKLPLTVEFLSAPADFDPAAYATGHPNFNNLPIIYGGLNGVPQGNYTVKITDGCGSVFTNSTTVTNGTIPFSAVGIINCKPSIALTIPGSPIASVSIIQAPVSANLTLPFNASSYIFNGQVLITNILTQGSYILSITDICGNNYIYPIIIPAPVFYDVLVSYKNGCSQDIGSVNIGDQNIRLENVIFLSGPNTYLAGFPHDVSFNITANGIFSMNSLPSGIYVAKTTDVCGIVRTKTLFLGGYYASTEYEVMQNCSSFNLYLEHLNNNYDPNLGYWIQKRNELNGNWEHPYIGGNYNENDVPNETNSRLLNNGATNNNIGENGHYRILTLSDLYPNKDDFSNISCLRIIAEFDVSGSITVNSITNFSCSQNTSDFYIDVNGNGPFNFKIIEKNGTVFTVENNQNPLFTNIETGVYKIQIEDGCGNITTRIHDVFQTSSFQIVPFLCANQNSTLSIPNFPYLTYEWFREGSENVILSTTSILNITNLNFNIHSGNYYVNVTYPENPQSCLNKLFSFNLSLGSTPNAGFDNQIVLCSSSLSVDLNNFLLGDFDENGTWEQVTSGGSLALNIWNLENVENGTYTFKYIVNGLCGVTDEANITLEILDEIPVLNIIANSVCVGSDLNILVTNGNPSFNYSWTGPNNFNSTAQNPTITNATIAMSGVYNLTVTAGNCQSFSSVEVSVNSLPDFIFANENIVICQGQSSIIEVIPASVINVAYEYVWYFNEEEIAGEITPIIEVNEAGNYSVTISSGDCSIIKTINVTENANGFQVAIISGCENNLYIIKAISIDESFDESTATYSWTGPNNFSASTQSIDITNSANGTYNLVVTAQNGCSVMSSTEIRSTNCRIPKGVSPNGDGKNDNWDLSAFSIQQVTIFNRFGQEVFNKSNYKNEWFGQNYNGKLLPTATYYFYIRFTSGEENTGWVYLNRSEN